MATELPTRRPVESMNASSPISSTTPPRRRRSSSRDRRVEQIPSRREVELARRCETVHESPARSVPDGARPGSGPADISSPPCANGPLWSASGLSRDIGWAWLVDTLDGSAVCRSALDCGSRSVLSGRARQDRRIAVRQMVAERGHRLARGARQRSVRRCSSSASPYSTVVRRVRRRLLVAVAR